MSDLEKFKKFFNEMGVEFGESRWLINRKKFKTKTIADILIVAATEFYFEDGVFVRMTALDNYGDSFERIKK